MYCRFASFRRTPWCLANSSACSKIPAFKLVSKQLESMLGPDLRHLEIPKAALYVVDAHVARPAAGALLSNVLERNPRRASSWLPKSSTPGKATRCFRWGPKGCSRMRKRESSCRARCRWSPREDSGFPRRAFRLRGLYPGRVPGPPTEGRHIRRLEPPGAGSSEFAA